MCTIPVVDVLTGLRRASQTDIVATFAYNVWAPNLRKHLKDSCDHLAPEAIEVGNMYRDLISYISSQIQKIRMREQRLEANISLRSRQAQDLSVATGIPLTQNLVQSTMIPYMASLQSDFGYSPDLDLDMGTQPPLLSANPSTEVVPYTVQPATLKPVPIPRLAPKALPPRKKPRAPRREQRVKTPGIANTRITEVPTPSPSTHSVRQPALLPSPPCEDTSPSRRSETPPPPIPGVDFDLPPGFDMSMYDIDKYKGYTSVEFPCGNHPANDPGYYKDNKVVKKKRTHDAFVKF